jgi:hypothetical protein
MAMKTKPSQYAFAQTPGEASYKEDPTRWHPRTLSEADLCERYQQTPDGLQAWRAEVNFPAPISNMLRTKPGSWRAERVLAWSEEQVRDWEAQIRGIAARLQGV